ncbi:hypothetical protein JYU34_018332 [Plutella xylostella]|uniref:Uncharacterized protein n=1 Tax=Plutella xylostella TaxID=51655 RepID=A0ABQ7PYN0_PLUXY|nr:hypothetical protein JYU34_018332 [Plutella xylostella]
MQTKSFVSKNLVAIIMVPTILGGHYAWYRLQQMDELVKPEQRSQLPILKYINDFFNKDTAKVETMKK